MVGVQTVVGYHYGGSLTVEAREIPLLSIDFAQGESDLNFVFFFTAPRKQRPYLSCIRESLLEAAQQYPVLLGHIVCDSGWKIVVDPNNINWPVVSEAQARNTTISALRRADFHWKQWPQETRFDDLRTFEGRPLLGVHIVRYACGGISLHTKVRHQAMDGNSIWRFYNTWSNICFAKLKRHNNSSTRIHLLHTQNTSQRLDDRRLLTNRLPLYSSSTRAAERYMAGVSRFLAEAANVPMPRESPDGFQVHRFSLPKKSLIQLKRRFGNPVSGALGSVQQPNTTGYVSTNDLTCAVFWRAIARAHQETYPDDPYTCMMLACDVRGRIGMPHAYVGNASFPLLLFMTKEQILSQRLTDTAMHIRRHVSMITPEFVQLTMRFMASPGSMQRLIAMFEPRRAFFSASVISGFPMFGMANFGFGQPVRVDIPAYLMPGFSIWMPTRSAECPVCVNLSLTDRVFARIKDDREFREFVDTSS